VYIRTREKDAVSNFAEQDIDKALAVARRYKAWTKNILDLADSSPPFLWELEDKGYIDELVSILFEYHSLGY
jgi:hypothetical protein